MMGHLHNFKSLHDPPGRASSLGRPNPVSLTGDSDAEGGSVTSHFFVMFTDRWSGKTAQFELPQKPMKLDKTDWK